MAGRGPDRSRRLWHRVRSAVAYGLWAASWRVLPADEKARQIRKLSRMFKPAERARILDEEADG